MNSNNPFEAFSTPQESGTPITPKTFHDELINLKGSYLEIYAGDQIESLEFDDYSVPYNGSIFGKLIEIFDRFIIIECMFIDKNTSELRTGNNVYINAFQIRAMTKLDGSGSLQDIFIDCRQANKIRNLINELSKLKK